LTDKEKALVLSINKANDPSKKYKEVFISLGGTVSKVYRTEVSRKNISIYHRGKRKMHVQLLPKKYGSIRRGIAILANQMREVGN